MALYHFFLHSTITAKPDNHGETHGQSARVGGGSEESIQALIRFTLEQAGFGVESALSAEEARTLLAQELPDVVLLDWMLPGAPGVQLAKQLRQDERSKDLPIILLTARSEDTDKELG